MNPKPKPYASIGEAIARPPELFHGMTWEELKEDARGRAPEELNPYLRKVIYGELCMSCNQYVRDICVSVNGATCCLDCREKYGGKGMTAGAVAIEIKIPPAYAHASLSLLQPKNTKVLKAWIERLPFVVIGGISGAGKTFASYATLKHEAECGRRCRYEDALDLRKRWAGYMPERREWLMKGLADTHWLILDALTDSEATEGWLQAMHWLLNERWKAQRPTLVTTMHNPQAIEAQWGRAVLSRLNQFHWTVLPPVDQRPASKTDTDAAD